MPGATVILDGGTTTLAIAQALPADLRATVVTHSPTVAAALVEHPTVEVFLLGGTAVQALRGHLRRRRRRGRAGASTPTCSSSA